MWISTKAQYGMRALVEVALGGKEPTSLKTVADRQSLSHQYLEQIFAVLRRAGIVESVRGAHGGYRVARPLEQVPALEVVELLGGPGVDRVLAHAGADPLEPAPARVDAERDRLVDRLRLRGQVERVHADDEVLELLVRAGRLREDDDAVPLVHERRLLRHEVQAVGDGVDEQDVELLRVILRAQRENYLPLRVIKDRIDSGALDPSGEIRVDGEVVTYLAIVLLTTPLQSAGEEYGFRGLVQRSAGSWFRSTRVALVVALTRERLGRS